ncbi:hypothetical protein HYO65_gp066 [Tenacibaculum phage PTm1]|uniref:Uncharacterized protein n=2 Tax=Shirahamavirus PTm1 TaxID=2846435 RepID=A0A5S9HX97_9CAUD|nr:hypothetical protein HYO65_gp066 [Tenacibaculum phage PTm1]BBI90458.1 hypothetical protein [Tenacibaculum phage PTm1]BBI90766.1 hypothetical protein [Tenacibaculum phage PTm5]
MYKTLKYIAESELDIVSAYIKTNDKNLIPDLLNHIKRNKELSSRLDEFKSSTTTLYRGIPLTEIFTDDEVLSYEQSQDFVATSRSEQIAHDYAKGKPSLHGKGSVNPVRSLILTYEVKFDDVILDLGIFDKQDYGTLETLINPKTAKLIKIEEIYTKDTK